MNFFTGIIQKSCQLFSNSYFKKHLPMAASAHFSSDFVANFAHVSASSVVVFICLSYCFQKETNQHKCTCNNICDMLKYVICDNNFYKLNILLIFGPLLFLLLKITDLGFVFSQWFFCKV